MQQPALSAVRWLSLGLLRQSTTEKVKGRRGQTDFLIDVADADRTMKRLPGV
jgi:hypothetical protein